MTQFVIYKKPEVSDKYYDDYDWTQEQTPFDDRKKARNHMPSVGSEVGEGYVFRLAEFEDDEDIPSSLTDSELRQHT